MEKITSHQVVGLMEAYNAVYSPQINEDYIWESCLTEEFISEAYQTVADYLVYNEFVPGYNTAEVYMSEMAVEDIDSILFETGVLDEQYLMEADFFQGIGAGADRFVSGAQKKVQGAVNTVQRAGQTAVGTVKRAGNAAVGGAQRAAGAVAGGVKTAIGNNIRAGQAVVGGAQRAAGAVQRAVTPVAQAVKGTAQRAVSAGQSALGGAARAVQGAGQAVVGGAQRAVNAVGSAANSATRAVGGAVNSATRRIGQEVEISRKVGAGEPLKPSMPKLPSSAAQLGAGPIGNKVGSTPSRFAGARDKAFSAAQGIKGSPVVGPKTATPASAAARPATPAAARPAAPAATRPAAATTGNPPLKPPALPPVPGKPSLASQSAELRAMQAASRQRQGLTQSFDPFDVVLGHLIDEGYADTEEAALKIMANMSEEWRESIVEGRVASETMGSGERRWERNDRYREENPTLPSGNPTGVNAQLMRQMAHAKKRGVKKKKN